MGDGVQRKILFCTLSYYPTPAGGAERQAQWQAEELVKRGHAVTVVCRRHAGTRSGFVNGVFVRRLPLIERRRFKTVSSLLALAIYLAVRLPRFELVHVHLANLQADVAGLICSLYRKPTYMKVAAGGPLGEVGRMRRVAWLTRFFGLRHATYVQALSAEIVADVGAIGVRPTRILRIPNGLKLSGMGRATAEEKADLRARLGLPIEALIVLYVGRFAQYKGVLDLVGVWECEAPPPAWLLLVGSATATEKPVGELLLPGRVLARDFTSRISDYYRAADIFVLPSHAEGMSNALLEAMASGLPCVATRVGAAEEMLGDGDSGLLVEPGRPAELAAAIRRLTESGELRERMGCAAARIVEQRHSIEAVVDRIEDAYDRMLRLS